MYWSALYLVIIFILFVVIVILLVVIFVPCIIWWLHYLLSNVCTIKYYASKLDAKSACIFYLSSWLTTYSFPLHYSIKLVNKRDQVLPWILQWLIRQFFKFRQNCGHKNTQNLRACNQYELFWFIYLLPFSCHSTRYYTRTGNVSGLFHTEDWRCQTQVVCLFTTVTVVQRSVTGMTCSLNPNQKKRKTQVTVVWPTEGLRIWSYSYKVQIIRLHCYGLQFFVGYYAFFKYSG